MNSSLFQRSWERMKLTSRRLRFKDKIIKVGKREQSEA